jgi:hypothetical protein
MKDGQSAANTKLDPDSAAYKALVEKHSYTGPATVFGKDYDANYAPLVNKDGQLTGALLLWASRNSRTLMARPTHSCCASTSSVLQKPRQC